MNAAIDVLTEVFGEPVHVYTRAQAIADGTLIDVSETAREAGFRIPVALTRAVWDDCVAWDPEDSKARGPGRDRYVPQDETGRLWDVLYMGALAARSFARRNGSGDRFPYQLVRVPRTGRGVLPRPVTLHLHLGGGDDGRPVVTIMQPGED